MSELSFSQKKTPRELGYGLNDTARLRKLILENPELPLVVFAGEDANIGEYPTMLCTSVYAYVGNFLDCDQDVDEERVFTDGDDFEDALRFHYEFTEECENMDDEEFDGFIKEKMAEYAPFWKKCIILEVNN